MATNKDVAKNEPAGVPAEYDYGNDSGAGMEDVDKEEMRIPFIRVLQPKSPQVDESAGGVIIEGAKAGMLIHMSTDEIWPGDGSVEFITCYRDRDFVEWVPVDAGGGLVGRHAWDDPRIADLRAKQGRFGKIVTPEGNEIAQTFYLYGIIVPPSGIAQRCVIGFSSTQIKKYQSVIDRVNSFKFVRDGKQVQPPLFAWRWKIKTMPEKNKKGSWFGIQLMPAGKTAQESLLRRDDPLFHDARDFFELLKAGEATADVQQMSNTPGEGLDEVDADPIDM